MSVLRRKRCTASRWLMVALMMFTLSACKTELLSGLDEADANEMLAELLSRGISASKVVDKDSVSVHVEKEQFAEAVDILKSLGLPKMKFNSVNDVFQSEGLVASPLQEWARLNYAKSQELSSTISSIPGVVRADVHLGEARRDSPFQDVEPPSASILVQMDRRLIREDTVPEIKRLVALAHPDIKYDQVGVIVSPVDVEETPIALSEFAGILVHNNDKRALQYLVLYCFLISIFAIFVSFLALVYRQSGKAKSL